MKQSVAILVAAACLFLGGCNDQRPAATSAENEVAIGAIVELTGKYAEFGVPALRGAELAIREINEAGGLDGRPLRLIAADTESDETAAVHAFRQLTQQTNMQAVIGPNFSSMGIVINPLAEARQIPFIATWATSPRVTVNDNGRTRPFAFRICFNDSFQGGMLGEFAIQLGATRAATLIDDTAYYSQALSSYFERSFAQHGGSVVYKDGYNPARLQLAGQVAAMIATRPDVVFLPGFHPEVAQAIQELRQRGYQGPIVGADSWEEELLLPLVKRENLDNVYYSTHVFLRGEDAAVKRFNENFRRFAPQTQLTQSAVLAYDAVWFLFDALKRSRNSAISLTAALEQAEHLTGISGELKMDKEHNANHSLVIIAIQRGEGRFYKRLTANPR